MMFEDGVKGKKGRRQDHGEGPLIAAPAMKDLQPIFSIRF
jgi:hypothetical protein